MVFWDVLDIWGNMDLNGDGYIDLVVRDYYDSDYGQVKIYFGSINGPDMEEDIILRGTWELGYFGKVICSGDLNADGYDDLIIAAPHDIYAAYGRVYIYLGGNPMDTEPDWFCQSAEEFAFYGESVVCGDLNADGYDDFIVGSPFNMVDMPGRIYIYSGGDNLSTTPVYIYEAPNPESYLGRKMEYISEWNDSEYGMILAGWINTKGYRQDILQISGTSNFDSLYTNVIYDRYDSLDQDFYRDFVWGYINNDQQKDILISAGSNEQKKYYCYLGQSDLIYPDTIIVPEDMTIFSLTLMNTIDFNHDGINEVISRRIIDPDSSLSNRKFVIDIYSSIPFPVSHIHGDGKSPGLNQFRLRPNYPNPFNASTTIRYEMPEAAWVTVTLYDLLGCRLKVFVSEYQQPGEYEIAWDAANFSSGIYFVSMTAGDYSTSRKILLMK
jgi:hypothetical protein